MASYEETFGVGANAMVWVSNTPYKQFQRVLDPTDGRLFYRRTADGTGTTRPALDFTNYSLVGFPQVPLTVNSTLNDGVLSQGAYSVSSESGAKRAGGLVWSYSGSQGASYVDAFSLTGRGCIDELSIVLTGQSSNGNYQLIVDDVIVQSGTLAAAYTNSLIYYTPRSVIGGPAYYVSDNGYAIGISPVDVFFERNLKLQVLPNFSTPNYIGTARYRLFK